MRELFKGVTSYTQYVVLRDSTTGLGKTGLAFGDITGSYTRNRAARTAITMATLASASAAYSSGGFIEVDATNCPGLYRFDVPDAAFATGVSNVIVSLKATGVITEHLEFLLTDWNKQLAVFPTATTATPGRTGGLPIVMQGGLAAASTATTVTLDATLTVDRIVNGTGIAIVAGTGVGQVRTIIDYDGTTKIATVNRAWRTNPDTTSVYNILGPEAMPNTVYQSGTAQAGGAATITLSAGAAAVDNFYNGLNVHVMGGTGGAQTRTIIGYVGATKVATVDHAWTTNPDNTSTYALFGANGLATDGVGGLAALAANVITATAINAAAFTAAKFGAGAIDANAIATDAFGSAEVAGSAASEIAAAVLAGALTELAQAQPSATPSLNDAIMLLYMALRNERILDSGAGFDYFKNSAGTVIAKSPVTDAAGVTTRGKMVAGP